MYITEATYSLRLFETSRQDRSALAEALSLYSRSTPPHERTASNEIMYWFDQYNRHFEDRLFLLGFYRNRETIGFAEAVSFCQERLVALDYLSVGEDYERNNILFEFLNQFLYFLDTQPIEYDYIVTEVSYAWPGGEPDEDNELWIDLLRFQGFGVVQASYQIPRLGGSNFESNSPGGLMVFRRHGIKSLKVETYLLFVDTILTKHYLRWYTPFLGHQLGDYQKSLEKIRQEIASSLENKDVLAVNGASPILSTAAVAPKQPVFRSLDLVTAMVVAGLAMVSCLALLWLGFGKAIAVAACGGGLFTLFASYVMNRLLKAR